MRQRTTPFFCLLAFLAMQGCATMNENECLYSDWAAIGYEDGTRGMTGDRIGQHRKACAKHGVTPDLVAYQRGREQGLQEYCRPENGFRVGASGSGLPAVCTGEQSEGFNAAYREGRELYLLQAKVRRADSQIHSRKSELENIADKISAKEALVIADESTSEERVQALADSVRLYERKGEIEAEIIQLERDRAVHQQALNEYQAGLTYRL